MKFKSAISTQKFVVKGEGKYTSPLSKQSNIESFLDQVKIGRYLPTNLDGIMIT